MDFNKAIAKNTDLKTDQLKAFKAIGDWYNNPYELWFNLSGSAGTGKTFLLNHILKYIVNKSVAITAPTHKALKIVERFTGRRGTTIHSLHNLRPNVALDDFDINNPIFDSRGSEKFGENHLVIIDECSQIGHTLYELTEKRSKEHNTKVLFLGDHLQLPPVKERYSRAFKVDSRFILNEIVRQEDSNPLLALFKLLRVDIVNGTSTFLAHIRQYPESINELGEGYSCMNQKDFIKTMIGQFKSDEFTNNAEHIRYAGWTNKLTSDWNHYIRKHIIGTGDIIKTGDLLTGYKTIVNEYFEPMIINSEDYVVRYFELHESEDGFMFYRVHCDSISDGNIAIFNIVDHTHINYNKFIRKLSLLYGQAISATTGKGKLWVRYFEFKDMYCTLTKIEIPMNYGKPGYVPSEVDYGYGLTTHKLQGSTLTNIAINLIDICYYQGDKNKPIWGEEAIEVRNKLIYTALSRANKYAILLV